MIAHQVAIKAGAIILNRKISPDLRSTIICTAIQEGGEEEWNFAFKSYLQSNVASEKNELINSLSCTRQPWILAK